MITKIIAAAALLAVASPAMAQAGKPERSRPERERLAEPRRATKVDPGNAEEGLAAGNYVLVLTPARLDGRPTPRSVTPIATSLRITSAGGRLTAKNSGGLSLRGSSSGARLTLAGSSRVGKLSLEGSAARGGADGEFELTFNGGPRVEGGFVIASPTSAGISARQQLQDFDEARMRKKKADCNWWCTTRSWFTL